MVGPATARISCLVMFFSETEVTVC